MTNVQIAIGFRREAGDDFAPSGPQVLLQLLCCVGNAHLSPSCLGTEAHNLVNLHCHNG